MKHLNAGQNIRYVMVLTDEAKPKTLILEIKNRLESQFNSSVDIIPVAQANQLRLCDLVILAAKAVPTDIQKLAVPIIVLAPEALPSLGMAPNGAFGTSKGNNFINIIGNDPISAGITGRNCVLAPGEHVGWGVPDGNSTITALVAGTQADASIFYYNSGAEMSGLRAPHRRVAFLIASDLSARFTQLGWNLFDAAVLWSAFGPNESEEEKIKSGSFWYVEGNPTKVLGIEEYRQWVEDKIKSGLWKKIAAILSLIGFGGLAAAIGCYTWAQAKLAEIKNNACISMVRISGR